MNYIRRAEQRGQVNLGWLQSQHGFHSAITLTPAYGPVHLTRY